MLEQALALFLQQNFLAFAKYALPVIEPDIEFEASWVYEYLEDVLRDVTTGRSTRVIINLQPRSLKSLLITVIYVAWRMGREPGLKVIAASATSEVARRHAVNFSRLIRSAQFRMVFPEFALESHRVFEQRTTTNGYRLAVSTNKGITGQGADLIIVDDPNSAQEVKSQAHRDKVVSYYTGTLYTRLTNKQKGQIVIVQQRLHGNDLSGFLLERSTSWRHVAIPAIAPDDKVYRLRNRTEFYRKQGDILLPRYNTSGVIKEIRESAGASQFEAQYQQNPTPADGQIVKFEWIVSEKKMPTSFSRKIISWDTASTLEEESDYSVGTVWGEIDRNYYLLDVVRGRFDPVTLYHLIEHTHLHHRANVTIIENTELGRALRAYLVRDSRITPYLKSVRFNKVARLEAQAHKFEIGQVHMPEEATWRGELLKELMSFPKSRHDDQVDSISQALDYMSNRSARVEKQLIPASRDREIRRPRGKVGVR